MSSNSTSQFITESGQQVILLSADFMTFKFNKLRDEYNKNGCISWEVKNGALKNAKTGDIIFIYYKNLPSSEGYTQSRILLKGIVKDEIMQMNKNDIYLCDDNKHDELTYGITIEKLMPVELIDYKKFSLPKLRENYAINKPPQTSQYFWKEHGKLYYDLEESINEKYNIDKFIEYFNPECFFQEHLHPKINHSFIAKNDCVYYEKHHFIQQYIGRKEKDKRLNDLIESSALYLCPVCHKKIHYGTDRDINNMIEIVYKHKKQFFVDNDFSMYFKNGEKNVLEWIKNMYKINIKAEGE